MLTYHGKFDEQEVADAARLYLPLYGVKEREMAEVPFKNGDTGEKRFIQFMWLAGQWVFVDVK